MTVHAHKHNARSEKHIYGELKSNKVPLYV